MRPQYSLTTAPTTEPVSYAEAADHLRVDSDADEGYIEALIAVAREYVESITGRVCGTSQWLLTAACWSDLAPDRCWPKYIPIHRTPLVSIQSVSYYADGEDTLTVMDADDWRAITAGEPGMLQILADLPSVDERPDAVQIAFTAGHEDPTEAPAILRHAVKLMVANLYEQRVPVAFASAYEIPHTLKSLLENQKLGGWFA